MRPPSWRLPRSNARFNSDPAFTVDEDDNALVNADSAAAWAKALM
jgi:hypothetical protein